MSHSQERDDFAGAQGVQSSPGRAKGRLSRPGHKSRRDRFSKSTVPWCISKHIDVLRTAYNSLATLERVAGPVATVAAFIFHAQRTKK